MKKVYCLAIFLIGVSFNSWSQSWCGRLYQWPSGQACQNTTYYYYAPSGNQNYNWLIPTGGTKVGGGGSSDHWIAIQWYGVTCAVYVSFYTPHWNFCQMSMTVQVAPRPTPTINGSNTFCSQSSSQMSYTTDLFKSNYLWSVNNGANIVGSATLSSVQVNFPSPGQYVLSVRYTNPGGCVSTGSYIINGNSPQPPPAINDNAFLMGSQSEQTFCFPTSSNNYTYYVASGFSNYMWSITGGTIVSGGGTNDNTIVVNWGDVPPCITTACKTLRVSFRDNFGCQTLTSLLIVRAWNPTPGILGASTSCRNVSGNLYATEPGMSNYLWSITGGTIDAGQGTANVSVTWLTTGVQSISVSYDRNGCPAISPSKKTVSVNSCGGTPGGGRGGEEIETAVRAYPNPADQQILLTNTNGQIEEVVVFDVFGKRFPITLQKENDTNYALDTSNLPDGTYLLKVVVGEKVQMKRISVKH